MVLNRPMSALDHLCEAIDRKSGTRGLFQLKSQDPFARATAELTHQRDNALYGP